VWNLLSNAVKFTPPRGTIEIELRSGGDDVEIVVRDSGEGIDPEFLPHVFERFRQADSGPARQHGGLGLGLAIVRHLTEAHGGMVVAHSDGAGRGSTFVVRLPVETAGERRRPSAGREDGLAASRSIHGVRILVVDDEPDALDLARVVLETSGGDVTAVASADDVLRVMRQRTFDALVADIGMPDRDGYSLIRAIRSLPVEQGGSIRAIAVTAYTTLRERQETLNAGFDVHLAKPVAPDRLVAAVAAVVRASSSQ
jgi:CheY-like chemotaxis protein